jgi:NADH-quinone oxidoreductase subunit L
MFKMGGLGKEMRITNVCFLIGILALMGIPIFNGFWSKDMIMHHALAHNYWVFVLLLFAALATVGYSWRMYRLVFLSEKKGGSNAHDPPWQMSVPLVLLALGSIISWLILPRYSDWMLTVLHSDIEAIPFGMLIEESFFSPIIIVTLIIIVLLVSLIASKEKIEDTFVKPTNLNLTLKYAYGFDFAYSGIADLFVGASKKVRKTQTGDLNYNVFGIGIGMIVCILLILIVYWWWL